MPEARTTLQGLSSAGEVLDGVLRAQGTARPGTAAAHVRRRLSHLTCKTGRDEVNGDPVPCKMASVLISHNWKVGFGKHQTTSLEY